MNTMKKRILSLIMAAAMLCSLMACGENGTTANHVHTFSDWEVTTQPSAAAAGMQTRTCGECGYEEFSQIPAPEESDTPDDSSKKTVSEQSAIAPLGIARTQRKIEAVDGVKPYDEYWFQDAKKVTANLSDAAALAYSLTFDDKTTFAAAPAGFDPESLLEWGKYPGLNMDILQKYGFTGKGAVIAYVDQPFAPHEQYSGGNIHYTNNAKDINNSMHGPAVLSLLAGKDIGTAPEAEVYFYGHSAWLEDQTTHAECLYQIIEQNKALPEGQKITMVGFSDNIDESEKNADAFRAAAEACEAAGIMVWFCGENGAVSFLPMSDKNDYRNLVAEQWSRDLPSLVCVPSAGRTTAATSSGAEYIYWASGGLSWTMPYTLGLYAIVSEIDPSLSQDDLRTMIVDTAYDYNGMKIVNPVGFVAKALQNVNRNEEAQAMLDEVAARQKYLYAVMDTAALTKDDLASVGKYLASITNATVLVTDTAAFANAAQLYTALQEDAARRGGQIVGVQIFGTPDMVPAFEVQYKVQMISEVDEGGPFLTDLFYGNFNNDPARISGGYNVMDHFAEGWDVDLVPAWPVARLPLSGGEFTAFFEKYNAFALSTGLQRQELVSFSNPIFPSSDSIDNMGAFLNRMKQKFGLLDIPYRLYANQLGDYPVATKSIGGFTAENLAKENDAKIVEFLINTHGQATNFDKCYFVNDEEIRESLMNTDTINSVLDGNAYYLDCWACLNGYGMADNITTAALNGRCVGVFSATEIISNNGVNCKASPEQMAKSNFYYFYYHYLKALHEGKTRSEAFHTAQQEYATALIADSANGIQREGNYQFNLCNLLVYHNFGLIEPNTAALAMMDSTGYIAQAGQSVPKLHQQRAKSNDAPSSPLITDGNPVDSIMKIPCNENIELKTGTLEVHSLTAQKLDNEYIRFTLELTAREGLPFCVFNPPDGNLFMFRGGSTTGERQTFVFDIPAKDVKAVYTISISFSNGDDDRAFIFFQARGIV